MDGKRGLAHNLKMAITILAIVILVAVLGVLCYRSLLDRKKFVFTEHLDDTAVTINGEALPYRELSFYVMYIEQNGEKQARIYNPESPKDWWNSYLNGKFVSVRAAETALDMAVHDHIMYKLAIDKGVTLDDEDMADVLYRTADFWEDLYDEQLKRVPVPREEINRTIMDIAVCDKYRHMLAEERGVNDYEYDYDGYEYKKMLESDYDIDIDSHYKKLVFGEITLNHTKVNYINGLTSSDSDDN